MTSTKSMIGWWAIESDHRRGNGLYPRTDENRGRDRQCWAPIRPAILGDGISKSDRLRLGRYEPLTRGVLLDAQPSELQVDAPVNKHLENWRLEKYTHVADKLVQASVLSNKFTLEGTMASNTLKLEEASVTDVTNQPNWSLPDVGDENFLVIFDPAGKEDLVVRHLTVRRH